MTEEKQPYHRLIQYLDMLRPLVYFTTEVIDVAIERFLSRANQVLFGLDDFDLSIEEALDYFPDQQKEILPFVRMLAVKKPLLGFRVFLLDILTVLAVVVRGKVETKARFLFDWYHFTRTGLMTELEHSMLIMRAANVLHRVKLMGLIEITRDDARFAAFQARVRNDGSKIDFVPGLTFEDFCLWIRTSRECKVIFELFRVLERFSDTIVGLRNRTDHIFGITEEIKNYEMSSQHVPRLELYRTVPARYPPVVLQIRNNHILCVVALDRQLYPCYEIFVRLEKHVPVSSPLYSLTKDCNQRVFGGRTDIPPPCCRKHFEVTSYRRIRLPRIVQQENRQSFAMHQIELGPLDPSCIYDIQLYSEKLSFQRFQVTPNNHTISKSLCVLPSSVDVATCLTLHSSGHPLFNCDNILFTGTVCTSNEILQAAHDFMSETLRSLPLNCCNTVLSMLRCHYDINWESSVHKLFGIFGCFAPKNEIGEHSQWESELPVKQVFLCNGIGPWRSTRELSKLRELLGPSHAPMLLPEMESLYEEFLHSLLIPSFELTVCSAKVFLMQASVSLDPISERVSFPEQNLNASRFLDVARCGLNVEEVTERVRDMLTDDSTKHIVLIVRSPFDLLRSGKESIDAINSINQEHSDVDPLIDPRAESSKEIPVDSTAQKLRGRHELLHGEYSSQAANDRIYEPPLFDQRNEDSQATDQEYFGPRKASNELFQTLTQVLFAWLGGQINDRSVTIVSVGWDQPSNFELHLRHSASGATLVIRHESLLATRIIPPPRKLNRVKKTGKFREFLNKTAEEELSDRILWSIQTSLPNLAEFHFGKQTALRTLRLESNQGKDVLLFEELQMGCVLEGTLPLPEQATISQGPNIIRVTSRDALLAFSIQGIGRISATLFELPFHMTHSDVVSLIVNGNKAEFRKCGPTRQYRCVKKRNVVLRYRELQSHCSYCVVLEPFGEIPRVAQFRTSSSSVAPSTRSVVASITKSDHIVGSESLFRLDKIMEGLRTAPNVICLLDQPSTPSFNNLGIVVSERRSLCDSEKRTNLIFNRNVAFTFNEELIERHSEFLHPLIHLTYTGSFCRVFCADCSSVSLDGAIQAIQYLDKSCHYVDNITLFAQRPLVRFLQRPEGSIRWHCDGSASLDRTVNTRLITTLLDWKAKKVGRDCQVISILDVQEAKCVSVGRKSMRFRSPSRAPEAQQSLDVSETLELTKFELNKIRPQLPQLTDCSVAFRHLILPRFFCDSFSGVSDSVLLCSQRASLGDNIMYSLENSLSIELLHIHFIPPRRELHIDIISCVNPVPLVYIIDVVADSESFLTQTDDECPAEHSECQSYNSIQIRAFLHDIDLVEIVLGPTIGTVTSTTAFLILEVNRDILQLECKISPVGVADPGAEISLKQKNVKAFQPIRFSFSGLVEDRKYEIFVPVLHGNKVLGSFKTLSASPAIAQVAVTGRFPFMNLPITELLMQQIATQQSPDLMQLSLLSNFFHGADFSFAEVEREFGGLTLRQFSKRKATTWLTLSEHLRQSNMPTSLVVHLDGGPLTVHFFHKIVQRLLELGRRLVLPVREAGPIGAWYFLQFEEVVKDTFRFLWQIPNVRDTLSVGSHVNMFTPSCLLPMMKYPELLNILEDEESRKLLQVVRKIFEQHYQTYVSSLQGEDPDASNHAHVWKSGSMVVAALDVVTDRKKLKKKNKNADVALSIAASKATSSNPFSSGFLDKNQWKLLKSLAEDKTVCQIFIVTPQPVVPLTEIPQEFKEPDELQKGETLEWAPTLTDLDIFLQFWISWLAAETEGSNVKQTGKTVSLVSTFDIPYVSVLQDLTTGLKVQQLCTGVFNGCPDVSKKMLNDLDCQLRGKIGKIKYVHKLTSLDNIVVDSSTENSGTGTSGVVDELAALNRPGFAILKVWFDSWKSTGLWSLVGSQDDRSKRVKEGTLVLGPILGAPQIVDVKGEKRLAFPVLVEMDSTVEITFLARNTFTSVEATWKARLVANRPLVCWLGPFELESRFNIRIISGIKNPLASAFAASTHISWQDTNLAVLNTESCANSIPCSDYIQELVRQNRMPFSGITAVLYLNLLPDIAELNSIKLSPVFSKGLAACRLSQSLTPNFRVFLQGVLNSVRELFRDYLSRPSLRELFRSSFNLMLPTRTPATISRSEESGDEDVQLFFDLLLAEVYHEYIGSMSSSIVPASMSNGEGNFVVTDEEFNMFGGEKHKTTIDLIYEKWEKRIHPQYATWDTWISPNGLVSVEELRRDPVSFEFEPKEPALDCGHRILVFSDYMGEDVCGDILNSYSNDNLLSKVIAWKTQTKALNRGVTLLGASRQFGTSRNPLYFSTGEEGVDLIVMDTIFRSTARELEKSAIVSAQLLKQQMQSMGPAKSKHQKRKQEEEERLLLEEQRKRSEEQLESALPDGYAIIECKTARMALTTGESYDLATSRVHIIGSVLGKDVDLAEQRPTYFDFLQLPFWFTKFFPSLDGIFLQDEVVLTLRQSHLLADIIEMVECDEFLANVAQVYEQSRLSELSRPPDLREVDMSRPGVVQLFLKDFVERVWEIAVPQPVKYHAVSLCDDFVRSLLLSKTMTDDSALAAGEQIAKCVQRAMFLSIALRWAMKMRSAEKWKFILDAEDPESIAATETAKRDRRFAEFHIGQRMRHPLTYEPDEATREFEEIEAFRGEIEEESDMEELDREDGIAREEEMKKRELEQIAKRMEQLKELEKAELQAAEDEQNADAGAAAGSEFLAASKQTKLKFEQMLVEAFRETLESVIETEMSDLIKTIQEEEVKEADMLEAIKKAILSEKTEEQRVEDAKLQMRRLQEARVDARRKLGKKITFYSVDIDN